MKRYEVVDHTADIGLKSYGRDLRELFANTAAGMFAIIAEGSGMAAACSVMIDEEASGQEDLLVAWLRELLFLYATRALIFHRFNPCLLTIVKTPLERGNSQLQITLLVRQVH